MIRQTPACPIHSGFNPLQILHSLQSCRNHVGQSTLVTGLDRFHGLVVFVRSVTFTLKCLWMVGNDRKQTHYLCYLSLLTSTDEGGWYVGGCMYCMCLRLCDGFDGEDGYINKATENCFKFIGKSWYSICLCRLLLGLVMLWFWNSWHDYNVNLQCMVALKTMIFAEEWSTQLVIKGTPLTCWAILKHIPPIVGMSFSV